MRIIAIESMDGPDSVVQTIYEDHCRDNAENTNTFISSTLFADLRTAINRLR
jgi:hypothetical protein